ncbi:carbon catabolite repressor protein 4 homolog 5 isoform X2 [Actinidia eriantha]|uniref:carbon catabolite repressor protein 4 homolog 5 isoform X2 n=1 Tax=Actinidia eriantha TaxID=165200 RepID=UPI0025872BAB|nr:carbon catabolite repressor protein 4 homolog 5 isoform X2 [Actinidia eriantha]
MHKALRRRGLKYTGIMRGGEGGPQPPAENSAWKRRHSPVLQQCDLNFSKRRIFVSETEALTLIPHTARALPSSNYTKRFHSSSRTHHKHQKHHRRKSSRTDCFRNWAYSTRDLSSYKDKVVFVSYNILGVENASKHPDLYYNVPSKFLEWDHRKKLLCKEISGYNASILCFQEVDRFDDLNNLLQKDGFRGVYQVRTGEACDGCAIFWKNELFTLLDQENIEFQMFDLRNNVAQFCVLKMKQNQSNSSLDTRTSQALPSRSLLVGNIHVLYNPKRGDIKLGQIRLFLEKAQELLQKWGNIPVVLAGDLNSMPRSAMYQFLASSELDLKMYDRKEMSGQICPLEYPSRTWNNYESRFWGSVSRPLMYNWSCEELRLATGAEEVTCLRHPLKLSSAYLEVHGSCRTRDNSGEPLATSYHSKFMGTVDYIWHTRELVPVRVLDTLPIDILRKTGGLPNKARLKRRVSGSQSFW